MKDMGGFYYKGFAATIAYNYDEKVFHGKVVGIPDLITFEGKDFEAVCDDFCTAVDDYLALKPR